LRPTAPPRSRFSRSRCWPGSGSTNAPPSAPSVAYSKAWERTFSGSAYPTHSRVQSRAATPLPLQSTEAQFVVRCARATGLSKEKAAQILRETER
jgi:hypothetical protein